MTDFTLIILRWYHGGVLDLSSEELIYKGGKITEFLDVDIDNMSYFELRDYIRKLGYSTTCTFSIKPPNSGILVDVDNDIDIFEMMCSLKNGDEMDVFVKHLVDEPIVVNPTPMFLENVSVGNMEKSGASFDNRPNSIVGEDHINVEDPFTSFSTSPPCTTIPYFSIADSATACSASAPTAAPSIATSTAAPSVAAPSAAQPSAAVGTDASPSVVVSSTDAVDDIYVGPTGSDFSEEVEGSDYFTEDSVDSEEELVGDYNDEECGSDVHEEVMELRVERRKFQRRKRNQRVPADNVEVPVGEAGPDLGFDDTETSKVSHEGRLEGDEPYFTSSDEGSFELDEDDYCTDEEHDVLAFGRARSIKLLRKKRTTTQKIIHDPTAKEVVWQLGMVFKDVNEFRRAVTKYAVRKRVPVEKWVNEPKKVRVRYKDGCPWLLYTGLDNTKKDFMIKTYIPKHTCNKTTKNYLCNAKFLAEKFRERIIKQPNIRVCNLQELIRKKFKLYVGKTTVRRARAKVLKDIMGDHGVEFGRILDYKDELLRTNPGTSCVVKLGEANEEGKSKFLSFYICFDALKKAWIHCRKCIGLDGYFLKGVCKGQLLVVVGKDGNNQMLPLAWEVVKKKNTNTWTWFVRCIRDDLGLGEGDGLTLITDMQKGLFTTIEQVLPQSEYRRCARHILANWAKKWRARHKTIISMLEEIRVKIMTRIGTLREFPSTWKSNYSPMCLKALEKIINRSMNCTIQFNGVAGFKVKEGLCQHKVDIIKRTCSFRVWQLKGIPCAHGVAVILFKKYPLYEYIDSRYKATTAAPQAKNNGSGRGRGRPKPGMSSSKIYSTGQEKVARSADVTGDIVYAPSSTAKLKWNGKSAISTRKLQQLKENRKKKTVGSSSHHLSQHSTSSQSKMP
ncbi:putative C2 and GRAM domain-containing protein-like [Capsicum annuum]|nr:putative C2 and GRAM domain-containing protein-like [Capsicum annuum]